MTSLIKTPNLPCGRVHTAVVGQADGRLYDYIHSYIEHLIVTKLNPKIDSAISAHADINVHYLGGGIIAADNSQKSLSNALYEAGIKDIRIGEYAYGDYPSDCKLNFARIGNYLFGRKDICGEPIKRYAQENGLAFVNVKQAYCKCSVCIVNENAVITDDISIQRAASKAGIDCLLISKGGVRLRGHEYGFIGGASALIDKNKLMFFGDIKMHKDCEQILRFLNKHNCSEVHLDGCPLEDIGGIAALSEDDGNEK